MKPSVVRRVLTGGALSLSLALVPSRNALAQDCIQPSLSIPGLPAPPVWLPPAGGGAYRPTLLDPRWAGAPQRHFPFSLGGPARSLDEASVRLMRHGNTLFVAFYARVDDTWNTQDYADAVTLGFTLGTNNAAYVVSIVPDWETPPVAAPPAGCRRSTTCAGSSERTPTAPSSRTAPTRSTPSWWSWVSLLARRTSLPGPPPTAPWTTRGSRRCLAGPPSPWRVWVSALARRAIATCIYTSTRTSRHTATSSSRWPTHRVRVFYDTGKTITVKDAKGVAHTSKVLQPMLPFGFHLWHDGPLYGYTHQLTLENGEPLESLAPGWHRIRVPSEGKVQIVQKITAEEKPKGAGPAPGPEDCPRCPVEKGTHCHCQLGATRSPVSALLLGGALAAAFAARRRRNRA